MSLADLVKDAGVVGAGGAGFPSHVKYQPNNIEFFIANGAECEPLLAVDQQLMIHFADELYQGMELIIKELGAVRGYIGVKKKNKKAVESLRSKIDNYSNILIHELRNYYPAGDEFTLVYDALGRVIPEGGLPLDAGVVVNNVMTIINVARAAKGIPVTERPLTVCGEVKNPCTMILPIGVTFREAIELAGGATIPDAVLISGGPMMGSIEPDWDKPITKTTSGLILLQPDNYLVLRKMEKDTRAVLRGKSTCDQCMYCTEYCPRYALGHNLRPHMSAMRAAAYGIADDKLVTSSWLCCECKLCDYYACPLFLSPGKIHGYLKQEMIKGGIKNTQNRNRPEEPRPFIDNRRVPTTKLINRLQLSRYNVDAPLIDVNYEPEMVRIPLLQHIGSPAVPVVKTGDRVKKGDLIGEIPEGKLGARVHASISGTVAAIDNHITIKK